MLKLAPTTAHDGAADYGPIVKTGNMRLLAAASPGTGVEGMKHARH